MPNNEYKGSSYFLAKAEMEMSRLHARDKKNLPKKTGSSDQPKIDQTQSQIEERLRNLKNPRQ